MTTQVINTHYFSPSDGMEGLLKALAEFLADAGDDRIAEGGDRRVSAAEVYLPVMAMDLVRERLTDGSCVYNLRFRAED